MKKSILVIVLVVLVVGILLISFNGIDFDDNVSYISDVKVNENILDKVLTVNYIGGNMIDEELEYGNSLKKDIEIVNSNNEMIVFALSLVERDSKDNFKYSVSATKNDVSEDLIKDKELKDDNLVYNLVIEPNSKLLLNITITSNKEGVVGDLKGRFKVVTNLTEKELFIESVKKMHESLLSKIDSLNGICTAGFYKLSADLVSKDLTGSILIDATDIANLVYYYSVTNGKYMIDDYQYKDALAKTSIVDGNTVSSIDELCKSHTKKEVGLFTDLPVNTSGGKKEFFNNSKTIINSVKNDLKLSDKKVYVIDVTSDISNTTNVRGYILADNTKDKVEYYIYLTDNLFMISGYNYTKYGDYSESSTTIRAYKESAFNLSASDKGKVCSFSGFSGCVSLNGDLL